MLLSDLAVEILRQVFAQLPARYVLSCRRVCRLLKALIDNDLYLQYKIELLASGMVDSFTSVQDTSAKMHTLRQYRSRLETGELTSDSFSSSESFSPSASVSELQLLYQDGFIIHRATLRPGLGIIQYAPPSLLAHETGRHWNIPLQRIFGEEGYYSFNGIRTDVGQDLLVVFEILPDQSQLNMHLLSLKKNGAPHLAAAVPCIQYVGGLYNFNSSVPMLGISVIGQHVSYQCQSWTMGFRPVTEVWNWRTGRRLWHFETPSDTWTSHALIDSEHIVIAHRLGTHLDVYTYAPGRSFDDHSRTSHPPEPLLRLQLPPVESEKHYFKVGLTDGYPRNAPESAPFFPSSASAILSVNITVYPSNPSGPHGSRHYNLLVPSSTIHRALRAQCSRASSEVPWEEWGPKGSVIVLATGYGAPERPTESLSYGSRYPLLVQHDHDPPSADVIILDVDSHVTAHWNAHHAGGVIDDPALQTIIAKRIQRGWTPSVQTTRPFAAYPLIRVHIPAGSVFEEVAMNCDGFTITYFDPKTEHMGFRTWSV